MVSLRLRRVIGESMAPTFRPGQLLLFGGFFKKRAIPGQIVLLRYEGRDIIKRVKHLEDDSVYVVGDNAPLSTDSRSYGVISIDRIRGVLLWPRR